MKTGRGSSPTITFSSDSDTGFYIPSGGIKLTSAVKGFECSTYVVTPEEHAEYRLYCLLDYKVPFKVKQDTVCRLYKSFLKDKVSLDDRSGS